MSAIANVAIHSSQFPARIRRDLRQSFRTCHVAHKFLYDSVKQTQKWLALHQKYSPSRASANCRAIYESCFEAVTTEIKGKKLHVIGLGCGGGRKDSRLLAALKRRGGDLFYTPCDVAPAMALTARHSALSVLPQTRIFPLVCDLQTATDLMPDLNASRIGRVRRIITFFGMIPNFEPRTILPKLASLVRPRDFLLFSANLAPGDDYATGVKHVLPQYANSLTREWLLTFLLDIGVSRTDGTLAFKIENGQRNLKRIAAYFRFKRPRQIAIDGESFVFKAGETIRLFYSYRYTVNGIQKLLSSFKLQIRNQWIAKSGEEGVFLCVS